MSERLRTLEYAPPSKGSTFPLGLARVAGIAAIATPLIGLFILAAYWLTGKEWITFYGLSWLYVGGIIALLAFTSSVVGVFFSTTWQKGSRVRSWILIGLIASLLSVPTAIFCVVAGLSLLERDVKFVIENATDTAIDDVIVHSSQADIHLGAVPPRTTVVREADHSRVESSSMTLLVNGKRYDSPLDVYVDGDRPRVDIDIKPSMVTGK